MTASSNTTHTALSLAKIALMTKPMAVSCTNERTTARPISPSSRVHSQAAMPRGDRDQQERRRDLRQADVDGGGHRGWAVAGLASRSAPRSSVRTRSVSRSRLRAVVGDQHERQPQPLAQVA
jgi:hypothetical protein